jgi:hypothetical protein
VYQDAFFNATTRFGKDFGWQGVIIKGGAFHVTSFSAFGSIMYAMKCIRPDVSHVISVVNPCKVAGQQSI